MSQLTDARFNALGAQGYTGSNSDRTLKWLHANGATSGQISTAWLEMLYVQVGENKGQRNTLWYTLLGQLGYTGALPDRELKFWQDGGTFGDIAPVWQSIGLMFAYEGGQDIVIDLHNYCFARPPVTAFGTDIGTGTGDPFPHILTVTWADLGSTPGRTTVNISATNAVGTTNWSFQAEAVAGAPASKPVFSHVPDFYSVEGIPGSGGEIPPPPVGQDSQFLVATAEGSGGVDMNAYLQNPPMDPGTWYISGQPTPKIVDIDPDTGLLTGRTDVAPGMRSIQVGCAKGGLDGKTNVFGWHVLPLAGWSVDFDKASVYPSLSGLTLTRADTQDFTNHLATTGSVPPDTPALTGQQWTGSGYTEREVGYGLNIRPENPLNAIYGPIENLAGLPPGGLEIEASAHIIFRVTHLPVANQFLRLLNINTVNPSTEDQIAILTGTGNKTFVLNARTSLEDSSDAQTVPLDGTSGSPNLQLGDIGDIRIRVSRTTGLRMWVSINGGTPVVASDTYSLGAQNEPLDRIAIGGGDVSQYPMDVIHVRIVPSGALTDAQIEAWDYWTPPVPRIIDVDPEFLYFGNATPEAPIVSVSSTNQTGYAGDQNPGETVVFPCNVNGGSLPYNYLWEWSAAGSSYQTVADKFGANAVVNQSTGALSLTLSNENETGSMRLTVDNLAVAPQSTVVSLTALAGDRSDELIFESDFASATFPAEDGKWTSWADRRSQSMPFIYGGNPDTAQHIPPGFFCYSENACWAEHKGDVGKREGLEITDEVFTHADYPQGVTSTRPGGEAKSLKFWRMSKSATQTDWNNGNTLHWYSPTDLKKAYVEFWFKLSPECVDSYEGPNGWGSQKMFRMHRWYEESGDDFFLYFGPNSSPKLLDAILKGKNDTKGARQFFQWIPWRNLGNEWLTTASWHPLDNLNYKPASTTTDYNGSYASGTMQQGINGAEVQLVNKDVGGIIPSEDNLNLPPVTAKMKFGRHTDDKSGQEGWSKFGFYYEMSSAPGVRDGKYYRYVDDQRVLKCDDVEWMASYGDIADMNFNMFILGGNQYWHNPSEGINSGHDDSEKYQEWVAFDSFRVYADIPAALRDSD